MRIDFRACCSEPWRPFPDGETEAHSGAELQVVLHGAGLGGGLGCVFALVLVQL